MKMQIKQVEMEKRKMERLNDNLKKKIRAVRCTRPRLVLFGDGAICRSCGRAALSLTAAARFRQNLESMEKSQPGASHWINDSDRHAPVPLRSPLAVWRAGALIPHRFSSPPFRIPREGGRRGQWTRADRSAAAVTGSCGVAGLSFAPTRPLSRFFSPLSVRHLPPPATVAQRSWRLSLNRSRRAARLSWRRRTPPCGKPWRCERAHLRPHVVDLPRSRFRPLCRSLFLVV